jgi:hypothetical protein
VALAATLVVLAVAAAGCGGGTSTTTTTAQGATAVNCTIRFAKTKFAVHAGVAAGAFYRYIYNPWRAGTFKQGAPGRQRALAKAAASGLVVVHELRVAARDARCDGQALKKLASPISSLLAAVTSLQGLATGGIGSIGAAATAFDELKTAAAAAGATVKQR